MNSTPNSWIKYLPQKRKEFDDPDELSEEEMYADDELDLGDIVYGNKVIFYFTVYICDHYLN